MRDYLIRAETRAAWQAFATGQGWLVDDLPAEDVRIDEIGAVEITSPVFDDDFNTIIPPVMDDRHHVNLRLLTDGPSILRHGTVIGESPNQIEVLNPADIETPIRVWADGMYFDELPTQSGLE